MLAAIPLRASIVIVAHAAEPSAAAIEEVIVHVQGLASDDLLRDLELRSPGLALKLQAPGQPLELPSERPWAYVLARAVDDGAAITVILADGRAYDRRVSAAADQAPRATASALANLLAAIVEDRVAPDRQDVTPTAALREATDGAETPEPEPEPAPEREPAPEPAPEPEPEPKPVTPPQDTKPRWSIIPELAPIFALQLGPPSDTGVVGGGGIGLGLGLRGPRGARVGLDLRGLWNGGQSLAVHRYRVGVRGGYELRRGRFVLVTDALFGVEPWLARADGRRVDVGASADDSAPAVALALGARVLPAIDLGLGTGGRTRLRLGLQAELAYTGVVDEGLRAARITLSDGADEARLRLGGLELALGLLIAIPHDLGGR